MKITKFIYFFLFLIIIISGCARNTATQIYSSTSKFVFPFKAKHGNKQRFGTAFSIGNNKFITAYHVVKNCTEPKVIMNRQFIDVQTAGYDKEKDVAIIELKNENNDIDDKGLTYDLATEVKTGETVYLYGNEFGTGINFKDAMVGSLYDKTTPEQDYIQLNGIINSGNSGGPVISSKGIVVGILNTSLAPEKLSGIGYATHGHVAQKRLSDLVKYGEVKKPSLYIEAQEEQLWIDGNSTEVLKVTQSDQPNLQVDDYIISVENQVATLQSVDDVLQLAHSGDKIRIKILRDKTVLDTTLTAH